MSFHAVLVALAASHCMVVVKLSHAPQPDTRYLCVRKQLWHPLSTAQHAIAAVDLPLPGRLLAASSLAAVAADSACLYCHSGIQYLACTGSSSPGLYR